MGSQVEGWYLLQVVANNPGMVQYGRMAALTDYAGERR